MTDNVIRKEFEGMDSDKLVRAMRLIKTDNTTLKRLVDSFNSDNGN